MLCYLQCMLYIYIELLCTYNSEMYNKEAIVLLNRFFKKVTIDILNGALVMLNLKCAHFKYRCPTVHRHVAHSIYMLLETA